MVSALLLLASSDHGIHVWALRSNAYCRTNGSFRCRWCLLVAAREGRRHARSNTRPIASTLTRQERCTWGKGQPDGLYPWICHERHRDAVFHHGHLLPSMQRSSPNPVRAYEASSNQKLPHLAGLSCGITAHSPSFRPVVHQYRGRWNAGPFHPEAAFPKPRLRQMLDIMWWLATTNACELHRQATVPGTHPKPASGRREPITILYRLSQSKAQEKERLVSR